MANRLSSHANSYARNPAQEQARSAAAAAQQQARQASAAQVTKAQGPAAAAAPAAPATPMPWDSTYESNVDTIDKNRDTDYATVDNQIAAAKQSYGFDDTTDPFSKIAMFKQAFANQQRGIANSGQLYSGSTVNAQTEAQHQSDVGTDALRRDYDSTLNDLAAKRSQIGHDADDATAAADWQRTQTATAARPDPTTTPAAAAAPAFKAQAGTDSKGNAGTWHIYPDGHKVFVKGK